MCIKCIKYLPFGSKVRAMNMLWPEYVRSGRWIRSEHKMVHLVAKLPKLLSSDFSYLTARFLYSICDTSHSTCILVS